MSKYFAEDYYFTALEMLSKHFDDVKKAELWLNTENPLLGNVAPYNMILLGRGEKLINFIESQLDGINP